MWDAAVVHATILHSADQFVHMQIMLARRSWLFTAVYASPTASVRADLWPQIAALAPSCQNPWMVAGDFNAIADVEDKIGGVPATFARCAKFGDWIDDCGLIDMGFNGPRFTWIREWENYERIAVRLDRALCNEGWRLLYPEASVLHLPRLYSDHSPILVRFDPAPVARSTRPFRFQAAWFKHNDFDDFVRDNWCINQPLHRTLKHFSTKLHDWNHHVFGNIFRRKDKLLARIRGIQRSLALQPHSSLRRLERNLLQEYNLTLEQEEILWYQKSRVDWIRFGDRNTRFFHTSTIIRRRRNRITCLELAPGLWCEDDKALQAAAREYFIKLFTEDQQHAKGWVPNNAFPVLTSFHQHILCSPVTQLEVKKAVMKMAPFKAPGPDGFQAIFYRCWEVVQKEVFEAVQYAWEGHELPKGVNDTLLVLIPKSETPTSLRDFRPISLCNVAYKILTKVIVNRLKTILPRVISPNQVSFVPGRQITDNIILMQEAVHSLSKKQGRTGFMALKIDLEKAYDKVKWSFLRESLEQLNLESSFVSLIMHCVTTTTMKILWNGGETEAFQPQRGLRQGDPLSPYLFVICMERLAHRIQWAVQQGAWKPIHLSRGGPGLTHLFFADDLVLFSEATTEQAEVVMTCLEDFCAVSGQKINFEKSQLFFSKNVNSTLASEISNRTNIRAVQALSKYLGVEVGHGRVSKARYDNILSRVKKRLAGWKANMLSLAGRLTLVQSATSTIPYYHMQTSLLPTSILDEIDRRNRGFLLASTDERRRMHLISWETVTRPKHLGGLGLKRAHDMNIALLAKQGWRFFATPEVSWVNILRHKYKGSFTGNFQLTSKYNYSATWRGIVKAWNMIEKGAAWSPGYGSDISFWKSRWLLDCPLVEVQNTHVHDDELALPVRAYYDDQGGWRWDRLQSLPQHVRLKLHSVMLAGDPSIPSRIIWTKGGLGKFSCKSAYELIAETETISDHVWQNIWRVKGPQRLRLFLWILAHGRLITNDLKARRGLTADASCGICGETNETAMHALRDCREVTCIWKQLVRDDCWEKFNTLDMKAWINFNLRNEVGMLADFAWSSLFGASLLKFWYWRNQYVWDAVAIPALVKVKMLIQEARAWEKSFYVEPDGSRATYNIIHIAWCLPEKGWVKVNSDGALRIDTGAATAGGVIRNEEGLWLGGFSLNLGSCSVPEAELWGCLRALRLAWDMGYRKVIFEADSLLLIQFLNSEDPPEGLYRNLVGECISLLHRPWEVRIQHIYREANRLADLLAARAFSLALGFHMLASPPIEAHVILRSDVQGTGTRRLVKS